MAETGSRNGIPTRPLGSTGLRVTVLGVGGYHVGVAGGVQAGVRIVRTAIDEGINFLDNAWCYNQGRSEEIMGRALRGGYRRRVVLMTKNHGRDRATFRRQLDESLRRLGTDCIDVLQFHDIRDEREPRRLFEEGALEAAVEARDKGQVRFIGFTGHRHPRFLRAMLERDAARHGLAEWDTVQLPINLLDAHYRSFLAEVVPILRRRGIGVIGMKSLCSGEILGAGVSPREAIRFALSRPIDVLVSGMDSLGVLRENLETVRSFSPMSEAESQALLDRVAPRAAGGRLERYKW